jgi:hypothetical protein
MARGAALARIKVARSSDDLFVSGPLQASALFMLSSPAWKRHLNAVRGALIERRNALVDALQTELANDASFMVPLGGMHLWVRLSDHLSDVAITGEMARKGVVVVSPGRFCFPSDPPGTFLRLMFGAAPGQLRKGAKRLGEVLWASGFHEPSPFKAHRAYQFFRVPWSSPGGSLQRRVKSRRNSTVSGVRFGGGAIRRIRTVSGRSTCPCEQELAGQSESLPPALRPVTRLENRLHRAIELRVFTIKRLNERGR